jgi:N-acetylmuramoyl-L-alanine amidase
MLLWRKNIWSGYVLLICTCFLFSFGGRNHAEAQADSTGGSLHEMEFTVCLDPGHPSEVNSGMTVQNGLTENHVNWVVACELRDILEDAGVRIVMTKSGEDELVTNAERAETANASNANLLFRIHCDSGPSETQGMTFYYPDRQGTWNGHTGPPEDLLPACSYAAHTIHEITSEILDGLLVDRGVLTDNDTWIGNQQGGALRGSILSRVPVVLVELCFLSNPDDAAIIGDPDQRSLIVDALASGILGYIAPSGSN